jgi:hypothetical protein
MIFVFEKKKKNYFYEWDGILPENQPQVWIIKNRKNRKKKIILNKKEILNLKEISKIEDANMKKNERIGT